MTSTLPSEGFVKLPEVLRHLPIGKTKWYEGIRNGEFPNSYRIPNTGKGVCWDVDDVRRVIGQIRTGQGLSPSTSRDGQSTTASSPPAGQDTEHDCKPL